MTDDNELTKDKAAEILDQMAEAFVGVTKQLRADANVIRNGGYGETEEELLAGITAIITRMQQQVGKASENLG